MNLFFNPSINEFKKLLSKTNNGLPVHDLVIDYDGEVLIDPHIQQPELDLDRFKVHVQMRGNEQFKKLFNFILRAWKNRSQVRTILQ
jgi:hypothetical protein